MLKKIGFALLCATATLTPPAYAIETHMLQTGITVEYELPSNNPQLFINYLFWSVEATCKVSTEDESNNLFVEALAKTGKINGVSISSGQTLRVTVHSNDYIKLQADAGAKVRITNEGKSLIKMTCST